MIPPTAQRVRPYAGESRIADAPYLPGGAGCSYGDQAFVTGGVVVSSRERERFQRFDEDRGVLWCQGGTTVGDIVRAFAGRGWFLPVVPGTQQVTVGGAIANDIHGKNHHRVGTFGAFVEELSLVRSDRSEPVRCSRTVEPELFAATIAGGGMTGLIASAAVRLKRIPGESILVERRAFADLAEFESLSRSEGSAWEYVVAWLDSTSPAGAGVLMLGNHEPGKSAGSRRRVSAPALPAGVLSSRLFRGANAAYRAAQTAAAKRGRRLEHYRPFFFPLDGIEGWNRAYGPRGFFQYQYVVPQAAGVETVRATLARMRAHRCASFVTVLKIFGAATSPGLLSFPMPGWTLALDVPNEGARTLALFRDLDRLVADAGGRVYLAKDAVTDPARARAAYPAIERAKRSWDPAAASDQLVRLGFIS